MDDKAMVDLLERVGNLFTSSLDLKVNIDFTLRALSQLVECDSETVFLLDEEETRLTAMVTYPYTEQVASVASFGLGEGIVGWSVAQRKAVRVADATTDSRFKTLSSGTTPKSVMVMPLESPNRVVGALTLGRKTVKPFTDLEQALVRVIANQAAISVDNAALHASAQRQLQEIALQKHELEVANAQIRENSRLKSEFLANMSHELRTPLNSILGFSEILKDNLAGKMSPQQEQECLENIHSSGRHLLNLVNDVLDLSKIEAGRLELQYEEFQVGTCLAEVLTVVRPLSERAGVNLVVELDNEATLLRADKGKFKQILYNLLSNAIKFTPEGGQAVIRTRTKPRAGQLVLQIKDSGIGIDPDHHDQIFSEFFQVQAAADRQFEGTGLGLALVKRLVGLHGGTIKVDSQLGRGASFTVTLPLRGLRPDGQMRNKILVIEDNPSSLELSTLVLRGHGFRVDTATDGQEGLQKAKAHPYDLILMDIQLPGIDGLTVTRLLKADPRTSKTPIVALSARAMLGDEREAIDAGCSGYITKPIEVKSFLNTVTEYLEAQGV
ncbi:MAG: ATP-binding protein [Candidatus Dormibacteraeota bacterium]|jgi:signal transduction histidine kinase|nr:ATP-binding protein [Candidatus Dormibacteraeota bacterium]